MPKVTLKAKTSAKAHTEIDWEAVHRQIEESNQKLANQEEMSPAALEQAWMRRSAQIARKIQDEQQGESIQVAIISLDDELYGLDVHHIFDIREMGHITFVPRVPAWALGVVNWRGRVLSVIDFRGFLGLPVNNIKPQTPTSQRLIVVQAGEMEVGLPVDAVFMIETVPVGKIRKEEGEVRGIKAELVDGIFIHSFQGKATGKMPEGQNTIVLLNLPVLLSDPQLVIREEIL